MHRNAQAASGGQAGPRGRLYIARRALEPHHADGNGRFTRLTNAFFKKLENHLRMLSLYFVHYNFVRVHKSLRVTPSMATGVSDELRDVECIASLIDARAPAPAKRGRYKKRNAEIAS